MFLFVYDFLSTAERKNPVGLIEAYTHGLRARRRHHARAEVDQRRAERVPQLERVRPAAAGRRRRRSCATRTSHRSNTARSSAECDAYVSLHRSEGFGLDMAKAMGLGKPVIATGYSGNLEFMDEATAYLVDYDL